MNTPRQPSAASFYATLVASTFLFGSSFVAGKVLIGADVPGMLLAGWRFLVASLAALPFVLLERPNSPPLWKLSAREIRSVVAIGLLQTTCVMALLFTSMTWISASVAAIVMSTAPIWVALVSWLWLGDVMGPARWLGLLLGVAGVALAIGTGGAHASVTQGQWTGELICLFASFCWAAATVVSKRAQLTISAWSLAYWQMLIGSLAILALAYAIGQRWPADMDMRHWAWFAWLAVPGSTGAFGLWFVALRQGGAIRTSSFLFLAPLFATLLSLPVFGTVITALQIGGGVLIAVALLLVNRTASPNA